MDFESENEKKLEAELAEMRRLELQRYANAFGVSTMSDGKYLKNSVLRVNVLKKYREVWTALREDWEDYVSTPWLMYNSCESILDDMSVKDLRWYCNLRRIKGYKTYTKEQLIKHIKNLYACENNSR